MVVDDKKLKKDLHWSTLSFAIMGLSGLLMNILIGKLYPTEVLGVFNLAISIYIVVSQFSSLGIHYSILKSASHTRDTNELISIFSSGLVSTLITGTFSTVLVYFSAPHLRLIFKSDNISDVVLFMIPAIFFYALNKYILNFINALQEIKKLSFLSSLRYVLLLSFIILIHTWELDPKKLVLTFSVTELVLFILLSPYIIKFFRPSFTLAQVKKHFSFGLKSFLTGTLVELNSKTDILILGIFCDEFIIGAYSMVAMIIEGIANFSTIFRNNFNPIMAQFYKSSKVEELKEFIYKKVKFVYKVNVLLFVIAIAAYPIFIHYIIAKPEYMIAYTPYIILCCGVLAGSGFLPFNMILIQAGKPLINSLYLCTIVVTNIILNFVLIPKFQMQGAAIATALSLTLSVVYFKFFTNKHIFNSPWNLNAKQ